MSSSSSRSDTEELDPPLTEAERSAVENARAAAVIVGGGPLVPYDVIGLAREAERLREALKWAVDWIDFAHEIPVPGEEQEDWERFEAARELSR